MATSLVHIDEKASKFLEKVGGKKFGSLISNAVEEDMLIHLSRKDRKVIKGWYDGIRGEPSPRDRELAETLFSGL